MARAIDARIDDEAYERIALGDDDHLWELWDGVLVEKPGMSFEHNDAPTGLAFQLRGQLDRARFRVRINSARVRRPRSYFIPDIVVVPVDPARVRAVRPESLETYEAPAPLVVEIWSPSTGRYDIDAKLPAYMARGDLEIWRLHAYACTLRLWRRQPDGSYEETAYPGGVVPVASLPGVAIDLDAVFAP